jgi:hypothetical protein
VWLGFTYILQRDAAKGALLASLFLFLFFSFGHVHSWIHGLVLEWELEDGERHVSVLVLKRYLYVALSIIFVVGIEAFHFWLKRNTEGLTRLTRAANAMAVILIGFTLTRMVVVWSTGGSELPATLFPKQPIISRPAAYKPDIYYIILDGYGRQDVLQNHYNFDNSRFLGFLQTNNFQISTRSYSNYSWTVLSLASSLNMQYLNQLEDSSTRQPNDMRRSFRMIRDSEVSRFLRLKGYRFIHLNSTWGGTMVNPFADVELSCGNGLFQNEYYRVLMQGSWLKAFERPLNVDLAKCHLHNFSTLEDLPRIAGPKFIFAHFILPHHPYLFDQEGTLLRSATISDQFEFQKGLWGEKDRYLDQLKFVNRKMEGVVRNILAKSEKPPIIVIQSDHGPALDELNSDEFLNVRFGILAAFHLPHVYRLTHQSITPVNIFRHIFNTYFDANLAVLPNQHYISTFEEPFTLKEVHLSESRPASSSPPN